MYIKPSPPPYICLRQYMYVTVVNLCGIPHCGEGDPLSPIIVGKGEVGEHLHILLNKKREENHV